MVFYINSTIINALKPLLLSLSKHALVIVLTVVSVLCLTTDGALATPTTSPAGPNNPPADGETCPEGTSLRFDEEGNPIIGCYETNCPADSVQREYPDGSIECTSCEEYDSDGNCTDPGCPPGTVENDLGNCEKYCPPGEELNSTTNECYDPTDCPEGMEWDNAAQQCIIECATGQERWYNESAESHECLEPCGVASTRQPDGSCSEPPVCNPGEILSPHGECISVQCENGESPDENGECNTPDDSTNNDDSTNGDGNTNNFNNDDGTNNFNNDDGNNTNNNFNNDDGNNTSNPLPEFSAAAIPLTVIGSLLLARRARRRAKKNANSSKTIR